ncbi:MAG: mitochondrial import inner membrane translocase subunit TIM16 [Phylliscum demangeonii]|nr:MAG: mitochondrial import inner membrane translocase subunit TIM16 [Phylliscum demangeonii]
MAHRLIAQAVFVVGRVLGRAVLESYRQAAAAQKYAQQSAKANDGTGTSPSVAGLTIDEACQILNVAHPQGAKTDLEPIMERFKKLFDLNEPQNGGSFYLQSKILRARERIEMEVRGAERAAEREAELKAGWNPKMYKDR